MSAAMMKIIITIQIIIINIYINLLFTTDSLKKVILIGESYLRFFKPNTGAMQCLIKGQNPKFTMNEQFPTALKNSVNECFVIYRSNQGTQESMHRELLSALSPRYPIECVPQETMA